MNYLIIGLGNFGVALATRLTAMGHDVTGVDADMRVVEEYKAQIRSDLELSNQEAAESTLLGSMWEALVKNCEVKKFPEGMIDQYVKDLEEQYAYYAQMYGMEIEEFFKQMLRQLQLRNLR